VESGLKATEAIHRMRKLLLPTVVCLALVVVLVAPIQRFDFNGGTPSECTIDQIIAEPATWENKNVKVNGVIEHIPVGIIQPFNYWLSDQRNQTIRIGVRWYSDTGWSGRNVTIEGVVKKGYAWVNPNYPGWWTYYIDATSICQD
jgi:hypothetical protein